jgi:F-type H+-transporting ATPase subunit delta
LASSTRQSRREAQAILQRDGVASIEFAADLFAAANALAESPKLRSTLTDPASSGEGKLRLIKSLFANRLSAASQRVIEQLALLRWSKPSDLASALELLGVRSAAASVKSAREIANELFEVQRVIASDSELELAIGARRLPVEARAQLLKKLFGGRVSAATNLLLDQSLRSNLAKRVPQVLAGFADQVAAYAEEQVAVVSVAKPLSDSQLKLLATALAKRFGRELQLNVLLEPKLVGGIRVSVGGEVIDASIRNRISQARLQLG